MNDCTDDWDMDTLSHLSVPTVSITNGNHDSVEEGSGGGEMDIHMAARHGSVETVQRLSLQASAGDDDVRGMRRGAVESTPAHDAAATGNLATLAWLIVTENARLHSSSPV